MLYVNPLAGLFEAKGQGIVATPGRQKLALQEYEHYFLFSMLQEMQKTVPKGQLFGSGPELGYYQEMLNDTLSGEMAKSGQFGIAKEMADQLRIAALQAQLATPSTAAVDATTPVK